MQFEARKLTTHPLLQPIAPLIDHLFVAVAETQGNGERAQPGFGQAHVKHVLVRQAGIGCSQTADFVVINVCHDTAQLFLLFRAQHPHTPAVFTVLPGQRRHALSHRRAQKCPPPQRPYLFLHTRGKFFFLLHFRIKKLPQPGFFRTHISQLLGVCRLRRAPAAFAQQPRHSAQADKDKSHPARNGIKPVALFQDTHPHIGLMAERLALQLRRPLAGIKRIDRQGVTEQMAVSRFPLPGLCSICERK